MMADRGAGDCSCPAVRGNDGSFDVPGGAHRPRSNDVTQCRESNVAWAWDTDLDASVIEACLASRIALGKYVNASTARVERHARPGERARRSTEARDLAAACTAAARVHAEIADIDGLRQHVREGLRAAACAHAPLEALRLRLLLVDGLRKAGRTHEGDRLARRLGRLRTRVSRRSCGSALMPSPVANPSSAIGLAGSPDATPTSAGRPGRAAAPATVRDLRLTVDLGRNRRAGASVSRRGGRECAAGSCRQLPATADAGLVDRVLCK